MAPSRPGSARPPRADENRASSRRRAQQRVERADEPPVRGQVDVHHLGPIAIPDVTERRERAEHAGGGDQNVDRRKSLHQARTQRVDLRSMGEVERHQRSAAAGRTQVVVQLLKGALRAGDRDDMGAAPASARAAARPMAARGPGHQCDAAIETVEVRRVPPWMGAVITSVASRLRSITSSPTSRARSMMFWPASRAPFQDVLAAFAARSMAFLAGVASLVEGRRGRPRELAHRLP